MMLMKSGANETFQYDSSYWTCSNVLYTHDTSHNFTNAKFDAFNHASINQIKIVSAAGYEVCSYIFLHF